MRKGRGGVGLFQILLAVSANVLIRELQEIRERVKYAHVAIEKLQKTCGLVTFL